MPVACQSREVTEPQRELARGARLRDCFRASGAKFQSVPSGTPPLFTIHYSLFTKSIVPARADVGIGPYAWTGFGGIGDSGKGLRKGANDFR